MGEEVEGRWTGRRGSVMQVAPEPLERGRADALMKLPGDALGKEIEILGRA